jgi:hypothetical protein
MSVPQFDVQAAHRFFSAECFNAAWDLMEKPGRSPEEDHRMLALTMASYWHWTQRNEHTAENMSVAFWQISRVYALLRQAENASVYGKLALDAVQDTDAPPYCKAYAYEALARAEMLAGNAAQMQQHLESARQVAAEMSDPEVKKALLKDLASIH